MTLVSPKACTRPSGPGAGLWVPRISEGTAPSCGGSAQTSPPAPPATRHHGNCLKKYIYLNNRFNTTVQWPSPLLKRLKKRREILPKFVPLLGSEPWWHLYFLFQKGTNLAIKSVSKHREQLHCAELLAELTPGNPVVSHEQGWALLKAGQKFSWAGCQ